MNEKSSNAYIIAKNLVSISIISVASVIMSRSTAQLGYDGHGLISTSLVWNDGKPIDTDAKPRRFISMVPPGEQLAISIERERVHVSLSVGNRSPEALGFDRPALCSCLCRGSHGATWVADDEGNLLLIASIVFMPADAVKTIVDLLMDDPDIQRDIIKRNLGGPVAMGLDETMEGVELIKRGLMNGFIPMQCQYVEGVKQDGEGTTGKDLLADMGYTPSYDEGDDDVEKP